MTNNRHLHCEDCSGTGIICWEAMPYSQYEECRVPHADPCGICSEWRDDEERLKILLERAHLIQDASDRKIVEATIARLLSGAS